MEHGLIMIKDDIDKISTILQEANIEISNQRKIYDMELFTCSKENAKITFSYAQPEHWVGDPIRGDKFSIGLMTDFWRFLKKSKDEAFLKEVIDILSKYEWKPENNA